MNIVYASTEEATEISQQDAEVLSSLGLNGQLFAFQLINFAIVALIVWFLILKPLTKKLEERRKIIDESLDKAKEVDANLVMAQEKFQEKVDQAKAEANKIIEKACVEAEQSSIEMKNKAKNEIESLVEQAKVKIRQEKEKMVAEVKSETAELVVAAVEKILEEKMDEEKDKELIEKSVRSFRGTK